MRTTAVAALLLLTAAIPTRAAETNVVDYELRVSDRPVLQRGFLPDSSPRSIAVGLPGGLSYCFDAEACRLRYAWSGGFLNMKPTWHERGAAPPKLSGEKFFIAPDTFLPRLGRKDAHAAVKWLGYQLVDRLPEFRYTLDGVQVRQRIEPAPARGLRCAFEMDKIRSDVWLQAPSGVDVAAGGKALAPDAEGWVKIPGDALRRFEVRISGPAGPRRQ
jgi:hypothetical protein